MKADNIYNGASSVLFFVVIILAAVVLHDLEDACYNPKMPANPTSFLKPDEQVRKEERTAAMLYAILGINIGGAVASVALPLYNYCKKNRLVPQESQYAAFY